MPPLSREQVLEELEFLAGVEHSLCVEYLSVHCALGHDQEPADEGATAQHVARAAHAAAVLAQGEMRHLHHVNEALVRAGRGAQLGRVSSIRRSSGTEVALGPLSLAELERLVEREREIAAAVDERYERLRPAVAPPNPLFDGDLLDDMRGALDPDVKHSSLPTALHRELDGIGAGQYLRARPQEPSDDLEGRLLELSDHVYRLLVEIVGTWFAHEDEFFGRGEAIDAMEALDKVNRLLVERGSLPAFTPPVTIPDPLAPPSP